VVTVGFLLGDATLAAAQANPDTDFAIVDFAYEEQLDNLLGLTFATDEAAYLAGYLAAGMSETGKVGTYGGIQLPTVTIFMEGFEKGIARYNEDNGENVELLGWSNEAGSGLFTGDFEDQSKGRQTTEQLLDQGADIIMPVAGPVGLGTLEAVEADGGGAKVIWVDTDGCVSVPDSCSHFLTSVVKNMDVAVHDAVVAAADGEFAGGVYSGTLENDGVGIADFHEFDDEVPQELKDKIEELEQDIISGELVVGDA
jgi:basic membrane protein A